ncbi:hypothetical protein Tco_0831366 [Tanacetum coccineum]
MDFIKLGSSSRVLSNFTEKYGSKNRVLAGFGIGGKSGKEKLQSIISMEQFLHQYNYDRSEDCGMDHNAAEVLRLLREMSRADGGSAVRSLDAESCRSQYLLQNPCIGRPNKGLSLVFYLVLWRNKEFVPRAQASTAARLGIGEPLYYPQIPSDQLDDA